MAVTNFADAIVQYRKNAAKIFNEAQDKLDHNSDDKDAQGKLAAGMAQLANAETMDSAQQGRDGYAQVVKLMLTTATNAHKIAEKLAGALAPEPGETPSTQDLDKVQALTSALLALAQLSPAAVWEKPTGES